MIIVIFITIINIVIIIIIVIIVIILMIITSTEQAGELLATFEMFESSGCEGNNLVESSSIIIILIIHDLWLHLNKVTVWEIDNSHFTEMLWSVVNSLVVPTILRNVHLKINSRKKL